MIITNHTQKRLLRALLNYALACGVLFSAVLSSYGQANTTASNNQTELSNVSDDPLRYIDREVYAGLSSTFVLSDTNRNATTFVLSAEIHWGIAITLTDSFEAAFYQYTFKENRVLREDRNDQSASRDNYIHIGLRASWVHYTKDAASRLFPAYEDSAKLLPFWTLGFSLEPTVEINDRRRSEQDGDVFWGIGTLQSIGYLHILPRTRWRLRYELGLLETYTPVVDNQFFFEPFLRVKLEYAFSVRQQYRPVEAVVISNPPLYGRDGKTLDELIAQEEGTISNFQFQKIIEKHGLINENVNSIDQYNIEFERQSRLLSLPGVAEMNRLSFDRKRQKRDGNDQVYIIHGYAVFLESYMDLRPDLPPTERRAYISNRMVGLARHRALLLQGFLLDNGVPKENIGARWAVVSESDGRDGALVSVHVANPDIVITRKNDAGNAGNVANTAQSFRQNFTTVDGVRFDLRKQADTDIRNLLDGNNAALNTGDVALASDTKVTVSQPKQLAETTTTPAAANAPALTTQATEQVAVSTTTDIDDTNLANNIYERYNVPLNAKAAIVPDAFAEGIVVELFDTQEKDQDNITINIPKTTLEEQKQRAESRNKLLVIYENQRTEWTKQSDELLALLFNNSKRNKTIRSIELKLYERKEKPEGVNTTLINQVRVTKLQNYLTTQAKIHPSLIVVNNETQPTIEETTKTYVSADSALAIEIIIRH